MLAAPVLQDVAARVAGAAPEQRLLAPTRWAYALRDAVGVACPQWVVTHYDLDLEAGAAKTGGGVEDVLDVALEQTEACRAAIELTTTLAGIYRDGVVVASLTGPATMAARLARLSGETLDDPAGAAADCGDALAALAGAHAAAGAARVLVWEREAGELNREDLRSAHEPLLRRLALTGVPAVAAGTELLAGGLYAAAAWRGGGEGAAMLEPGAFASVQQMDAALALAARRGEPDLVLLSDGPVPGDCDLAALRSLGERSANPATQGERT